MRSAIWENIFRRQDKSLSETAMVLNQVPVFRNLTKRELRDVENIIHHREYQASEVVFNMGDPGLGMYIVLAGSVQIVNNQDPDNIIVYSELTEGDFFGDLALVHDENRSASAVASSETRLIAFFRPEMQDIITRFPDLGNKILMNLAGVIAQRLIKTNELLFAAQKAGPDDSD